MRIWPQKESIRKVNRKTSLGFCRVSIVPRNFSIELSKNSFICCDWSPSESASTCLSDSSCDVAKEPTWSMIFANLSNVQMAFWSLSYTWRIGSQIFHTKLCETSLGISNSFSLGKRLSALIAKLSHSPKFAESVFTVWANSPIIEASDEGWKFVQMDSKGKKSKSCLQEEI